MFNYFFFTKTECCWIELWNLWQKTAHNNTIFWTMMIRIWRIYVLCKNFDKSQKLAVFHDYKTIDTLTDMMNWILVTIWLQNHILIWQARSEIWHVNITITRFVCELEWQTNYKLILNSVISETIWKNMTCFHKSQI